jgi:hypothetical protein
MEKIFLPRVLSRSSDFLSFTGQPIPTISRGFGLDYFLDLYQGFKEFTEFPHILSILAIYFFSSDSFDKELKRYNILFKDVIVNFYDESSRNDEDYKKTTKKFL